MNAQPVPLDVEHYRSRRRRRFVVHALIFWTGFVIGVVVGAYLVIETLQ
jgi:hypothetical protein